MSWQSLLVRGRRLSDAPLCARIDSAINDAQQTDSPIDAFISIWPKLEGDYAIMVDALIKYCEDQLHKKEINCDVSGRPKRLDSIRESAARRETHQNKRYSNVEEIFNTVHDLAGIRIVVEVPSNLEIVTAFIQDTFQKAGEPSNFTSDRKISDDWAPWFGAYQATNHRAKVKLDTAGVLSPYQDVLFEIQLTTLSEQLYNKAAHDWIYKKSHGPLTRRDEILIDMLHGAALIYSLGMVYLQDGEEKSVDSKLIDGIKEAYSKDDPETLVKMLPDHLRLGENNQPVNDQFSGKPIPFELVKKAMDSPASRGSESNLLESIVKYIEENMQPPIQLLTFEDARFDSARVKYAPTCYEGTRASVFDRVMAWVNDAEGETFFWLHSPAGTGKSTLARSLVAKLLDTKQLAAGYFFQRQDVVGSGTSLFFPTIASQLMDTIPEFELFLRKSLKDAKNPKLESKPLEDQFKILVQDPLSAMDGPKITRVIIVDALDECNAPDHLYRILSLFSRLDNLSSLRVRVFVTSRVVFSIQKTFQNLTKGAIPHRSLDLHREFQEETKNGIKVVLEAGLAEIKAENDIKTDPWPSFEDFEQILSQATTPSPLFIYAKTLLRFVNQKGRPLKRLKLWLERHHSNATQLEDLYATVFQDLDRDEETGKSGALVSEEREVLLHVLGAIVLVAIPLSAAVLADLLDIERDDVDDHVKSLHAVLNVPTTAQAPVEIIHKSFADFLLRDRQKDAHAFWVDAPETHAMLARGCIKRMCKGLCKNICKLDHPGTLRHSIKQATIDQFIPVELQYACVYWVHHVVQSKVHIDNFDISSILDHHFLHWLEALSLLGKLEDGIIAIQDLLGVIQSSSQTSRLVEFLKHAERFALAHTQIIERAPMQIYGSALVFTPTESMVYQKYWKDQKLACIKAVSGVQAHFNPCLQTLEAHEAEITAIAVSGNTIASASCGKQLKLWDSRTGIHRQTFECASTITAIAFLPDGNTLISISLDGDIQTWDMSTGIATLLHTDLVRGDGVGCAAFSPDCSLLATATRYIPYHVDWWNPKTGVHSHTFNGLGQIGHITFSPDGSVVALSLRYGSSVYLLHAATGVLKKKFEFDIYASAAAFSPDGSKLVIWRPYSLQVLDIATCTLQSRIEHPRIDTFFLGSSWDGGRLILANGRNLMIWDMTTIANQPTPEGERTCYALSDDAKYFALVLPNDEISLQNPMTGAQYWSTKRGLVHKMAFSPNGKILATASDKGSINILDTETSTVRYRFECDQDYWLLSFPLSGIAISSDGKTLATTTYCHCQLWNAKTGADIRTFYHRGDVQSLFFSEDGKHLLVDGDPWAIHSDSGDNPKLRDRQILVRGDWITRHGKTFLWLPEEYRPRPQCEASDGSRLVVVNTHGRAICFDFDLALLDSSPI